MKNEEKLEVISQTTIENFASSYVTLSIICGLKTFTNRDFANGKFLFSTLSWKHQKFVENEAEHERN